MARIDSSAPATIVGNVSDSTRPRKLVMDTSLVVRAVGNDIRVAIHQHARKPGFAVTVICTLGLTIGATTAVFSVVNGVLVRALPYASPDRLTWVASVRTDNPNAPFTLPEFLDYRSQTRTLSGIAAYANWSASLAGDGVTERLQGARVSANVFDLLGLHPIAGRLLNDSDDRPEAAQVVVLSHRLWQRLYSGSPDIIGKPVRINAESFVVVGVVSPQFLLPMIPSIDVMTPLAPDRDPLRYERSSVNFLRMIGRLAPGTIPAQAQAELTAIAKSLRQQFPVEYARKEAVRVDALHEVLVGDNRQSILILLAAVVVVLATAMANLAALALVRANARSVELTVRTALGASRSQLARQLATESVLLAVCGSAFGFLVAQRAVRLPLRWAPASIPRLGEVGLDVTVVAFLVVLTVLVTALLTLAPLGAAARARADDSLRIASRGAIGDRWNVRVRNGIVVAEIAAALVLLVATTVLLKDLRDLQRVNPGFSPDAVFQARVSIPPTYRTLDEVSRFYDRLSARIGRSPGVEQFGMISVAPLSGLLRTVPFSVAGQSTAERDRAMANLRAISPGYLLAVRTQLLQGRAFAETDRSNTPAVALVSAALADQFLSGRALGRQLLVNDNNTGPRPIEIVGVVENVRHASLNLPPGMDIYVPLRQMHPDGLSFIRESQFWMIRTTSDPAAFRATFLEHLRAVDPDAAVSDTESMRQALDESLAPRRFNVSLFGAFAATAIVTAVVGLYGLVSYTVSQRAREIGLRMAIGATPGNVQRLILRQAATLGLLGTVVGLGVIGVVLPAVSTVIPNVSVPSLMAAAATTLLFAVVIIAAWRPARRAARTDPAKALKAQ
jgi:putative ABC transport system permease protein